jgi:hypothetical protein
MALSSPEDEIARLHVFFEAWMAGRLPRSAAAFAPFPAAIAPSFTMVGPDGAEHDRAAILAAVEGLHGARGPAFRIWIEAARVLHGQAGLAIVRYDECQHVRDADGACDTRRRCTVVLATAAAYPDTWRWLAVQETWVAA